MLKRIFLISFLSFFITFGMQQSAIAENPDFPKAADWEFGWDNITTLKQAKPKEYYWNNNPKYDNQKVINSYGYKAKSVDEIKDLLIEPLYEIMKNPEVWGDYRINETAFIEKSGQCYDTYMEATEKYKGEAYLDEDRWLRNYTAGIPFPEIDAENDPQAAVKIVWNWVRRNRVDDELVKDTTIDLVDRAQRHKYVVSERLVMRFLGRLFIDPKPTYPDNPKNLEYLYTSINKQPYNVAGTIALMNRYDLPGKNDDMWVYVPSLRRVRRMSTSERQDKMSGGKDFIWDLTECFDGSVAAYDFELLETKMALQPICCSSVPSNVRDGYLNMVDDYWQRRKTYVIRAIPKKAVNISSIIFYVDAETFRANVGYCTDTKGRPWLYQQYGTAMTDRGEYLLIHATAIDLITRHSSKNWNPWIKYNVGLTPNDFSFEELKRKYMVR